jgi:hypothetical protein
VAALWWFPATSDSGTGKTVADFQRRIMLFGSHNAVQMSTQLLLARPNSFVYSINNLTHYMAL